MKAAFLYNENMNIEKQIAKKVKAKGGRTYYVGGYVRDQLLGIDNKDIDIEVHGINEKELYQLLSQIGKPLSYGKSFGVFSLKGYDIDIALPRTETKTGKSHHDFKVEVDPYMEVSTAMARRDFTMNAIYKDVLTDEIIDPYQGVKDIKNKVIRYVNETSFPEDSLRVLRGCQFASRFGFKIDKNTIQLCKNIDLKDLSKQRAEEELKKCLLKGKPSIFFKYLNQMNQNNYWFKEIKDVNDKAVKYRDKVNRPYEFMLTSLTLNLNKKQVTNLLNRFVCKNDTMKYVLNMHELVNKKLTNSYQINKMFYDSIDSNDLIYLRMIINPRDKYLFNELKKYQSLMKKPYVQGKDLIELGYQPNEEFSKILNYATQLRLKGYDKQTILNKIKVR